MSERNGGTKFYQKTRTGGIKDLNWREVLTSIAKKSDKYFTIFKKFADDLFGGDIADAVQYAVNHWVRMFLVSEYILSDIDTSQVSPQEEDFWKGFFMNNTIRDCFFRYTADKHANNPIVAVYDIIRQYCDYFKLENML